MKEKNLFKKITSFVISVVLLTTVLPQHIYAEEGEQVPEETTQQTEVVVEEQPTETNDENGGNPEVANEDDITNEDNAEVLEVPSEGQEGDVLISEEEPLVTQTPEETPEPTEEAVVEEVVDPTKEYEYRLIVGFNEDVTLRENEVVLGEFDKIVLLGFEDAETLNAAKEYYGTIALFASIDGTLSMSENESSSTDIDSAESSANETATMEENPLVLASDTETEPVKANSVIALIDTGAEGENVVNQLSVLGEDVNDNNGHGSTLANVIKEASPTTKVISIKALNENGTGTVASVYVAIKLAMDSEVDIILCPFSALGYSEAIRSIIQEATSKGIKVVVSAGNDSDSALNYTPANIAEAITVGALNEDGKKAEFSNYGDNIDAWVEADSTSVASAKLAAALANGETIDNYQIGTIGEDDEDLEFETDYKTTSDSIVDGGVYIIRLRKDPTRSLVRETGGTFDGNKFVLSSATKREDSDGQFKVQKINYNFYLKVRDDTNYIMSPDGGDSNLGTNGQKVHMWKKSSSNYKDFDQWYMQKVDNGKYYRISNGKNPGMHLQTYGSETAGGTICHLWNATSGTQGDWIFERVYYNVKFNGNGNTGGSMSNQKIWQEVSTALTSNGFTKTGYSFNGWNTKSDGTGTNYSNGQKVNCLSTTNNATINLYAKWKANTYAVAYNGNGATSGSMSNSSHTYDTAKALTANAYSRTGYTFAGWNTKSDGTGNSYANSASVKNLATSGTVTLYAQWTPNTYTVVYNGNGSTSGTMSNSSHTYGTAKALNANAFAKTGYYFKSWNTKEDGTGTSYADKASVSNLTSTNKGSVTLYAQWTANTYTVKYNGNGSTSGSTADSSHTYDTAKLLTANGFERTGYKFDGWNTTAQGTGTNYSDKQSVKNLTTTKDGIFNLYAKWKAENYVLALDANTATTPGTANVYYTYDTDTYYSDAAHETAITTITLPERTGYTFGGYYSSPEGEGTQYITETGSFINNPYKLTGATLYPKWTPKTYTVTFDPNGGVLPEGTVSPMTLEFDEQLTLHHPTLEGYTFLGWDITNMEEGIKHEIGGNDNYDEELLDVVATHFKNLRASEGTVNFEAEWEANTYTVRFDGNDGTLAPGTEDHTETFDAAPFSVKAPTRDGYIFHGWRITNMDGSAPVVNGTVVTGPTYVLETEADEEVTFQNLRATRGDAEITALWASDTYKVQYFLNGGELDGITEGEIKEYQYDHTFSCMNPVKLGYTFDGWTITGMNSGSSHLVGGEEITGTDISNVMGTSFGRLNMHGETVVFEARWESDDVSVILTAPEADPTSEHLRRIYYTFDENAYFEDDAHEVSLVQPIETPVRKNYTFTGYYESSDGTGDASIYADGTIHDTLYNKYPVPHNLYAGWEPVVYEITLSQDDATTPGTEKLYEKYNTGIYQNAEATQPVTKITTPVKKVSVSYDVDTSDISPIADEEVALVFDGYYDGENKLIGPAGQLLPAFTGTYFEDEGTLVANWTEGSTTLPKPEDREGYTFDGWYDESGSKAGDAGANYIVSEDTILKAHWVEDPEVIYEGNGSTSGSVEKGQTAKGKTYTVAANGFEKTGYYFKNWNTKEDGSGTSYNENTSVVWNEDLPQGEDHYTLYAQWTPNEFVKIQDIDNQPYTGEEINIEVVVVDNNGNVVDEEEYTLSYENNINVGTATVTATPKPNGNYKDSEPVSKTFNIVKAPYSQFKETKENYEGVYDGQNHTVKVTATTEDQAHAYKIGYGTTAEQAKTNAEAQSESRTTNEGYQLLKDVKDSGTIYYYIIPDNYEAYAGTLTATITPKELSVVGFTVAEKVYDGKTDVTLEGTETLDGVIGADDVTLNTNAREAVAASKNAGDQVVTITGYTLDGVDKDNYTIVQPVESKVTITKKPVTFTWEAKTYTYDGTSKTYEGASINADDIISGDNVTIGSYANNVQTNAGTYTASVESLDGTDAFNYSIDRDTNRYDWSIAKATNTINSVTMADWTYGKTASEPSTSALFGVETVHYQYKAVSEGEESWSDNKPTYAGEYQVKAIIDETDDYGAATAIGTFEIKKADITLIANDAASVRNQQLVMDLTFTITGDYVQGDYIDALVETTANPLIAGKYVTKFFNYNAGPNYNVTTKDGVYTVTRNDSSVTSEEYNGVYDGNNHGITVTVTGDEHAVVYYRYQGDDAAVDAAIAEVHAKYNVETEDEFKPAYEALVAALGDSTVWSTTNPQFKDASTTTVDYIVVTDQSKPDVFEGSKDVVIRKKELIVTAKDHEITYGAEAEGDGVEYSGFVAGESESSLSEPATVDASAYTQYGDVGEYDLVPVLGTQTNYEPKLVNGVLTVKPLPVTLTWSGDEFTYDGGNKIVTASVDNALNGDDVRVVAYEENDKVEPGDYVAIATTLGGSKGHNYTLEGGSDIEHSWSIVNRNNNVSVTLAGWTYGDTPKTPVVTADFNKETAVIEYFTKNGDDYTILAGVPEDAGTYYVKATVPSDGYYFKGESDYEEFNINKKNINILIDNKVSRYGNPLLELTYQLSEPLVNESDLGEITLSTTATKDSEAKDYPITASYTENNNYEVTVSEGTYTITKANLTANVKGYTGVYDGEQHGISVELDPKVADKATVYYSKTELNKDNFEEGVTDPMDPSVTEKDAGETTIYYYVDSKYYSAEPVKGSSTINISKKDLTVTAKDHEITYGDIPSNNGVTYDGLVSGDDLGLPTYDYDGYDVGSDVGTYAITPSGLDDTNYNIAYVPGNLSVTPLIAEFDWDEDTFDYTGKSLSPIATITNKIGDDDVDVDVYSGNVQTNIGSYVAEVKSLKGEKASNYKISNTEASTNHNWKIVQVDNEWIEGPEIDNWTYGKDFSVPNAIAKFGDTVTYEYKKKGEEDRHYSSAVPTQVGEYTMRATVIRTDNYRQLSDTVDFEIEKAKITITAEDQQSPYRSDKLNDLTYKVSGDYVEGDELGIVLRTDATVLSSVGEYPIEVDWDNNPNYDAELKDGTYRIIKAHLRISHSDVTETYDGQPHGIDVQITEPSIHDAIIWYSDVELTESNIHDPNINKTTDPLDDLVAQTEVGEKLVYFYVDSENFDPDPSDPTSSVHGSNTVKVTKRALTISVHNQTITYGDEPNASKPAVAKDGISYEIPTGCVDDIVLGDIHYDYDYEKYGDVGHYDITVSAESVQSENYEITFTKGKLIVNPKPITFTWVDENDEDVFAYDYDGEDHHVVAIPQTVNGDTFEGELTYENNNEHLVGSYTAKVVAIPTTGKAKNYTLEANEPTSSQPWLINQADNEWVVEPSIDDWTYGEDPSTPVAESKFGTGNIKYQYRPATETEWSDEVPTKAGEYQLRVHVPETANYKHLDTEVSFKINKAKISVIADDLSSQYLEEIVEPTYHVEGRDGDKYQTGDPLDVEFDYDVERNYHVGEYEIDLVVKNDEALNNYDIEYVMGTYTIEKADLMVHAEGYEGTYDGQEHGITAEVTHEDDAEQAEIYYSTEDFATLIDLDALQDDVTGTEFNKALQAFGNELSGLVFTNSPQISEVSQSPLKVYYLLLSENYNVDTGSRDVVLNKVPLVIRANPNTITFGDKPKENEEEPVTCIGFVNGETLDSLDGDGLEFTFNYAQFQDRGDGEFTITPSGLTSEDYEIEYVPGKLTVEPYEITRDMMTIEPDPAEFEFDDTVKKPIITLLLEPTDGGEYPLVLDKDYTLTGEPESFEFGTHTVNVNGKGNFTGTLTDTWRITNKKHDEGESDEGAGKLIYETDIDVTDYGVKSSGVNRDFAWSLLSEEEQRRVTEGGETARVWLEIDEVDGPTEDEKGPLNKKLKELGTTPIIYLEVILYKKVGTDPAEPVPDTYGKYVTLLVEVPAKYRNKNADVERSYYFVRVHNYGDETNKDYKADTIAGPIVKIDVSGKTDKFSLYVVSYKDTPIEKPNKKENKYVDPNLISVPNTADPTDLGLWIGMLLLSIVSFFTLKRMKKSF